MSVTSSDSAAYSGALEGSNAQRGLWSSRLAFILAATGSAVAAEILDNWSTVLGQFVKVMPTDYKRVLAERKQCEQALVT